MDRNHLEDKEGQIQQNPSTEDKEGSDLRMERGVQVQQSWFTSSFLYNEG